MSESKNWYAVYTRPKMEKRVSILLNRLSIENYCPLNKILTSGGRRKKFLLEPLFASCVFVRVNDKEKAILKKIDGIISLVYWLGNPVIIQHNEIEMIKNMVNDCINIKLEKKPVNLNDKVGINGNAYTQIDRQVIGLNTRILVGILPSFGYAMKAEVEIGSVKAIEPVLLGQIQEQN